MLEPKPGMNRYCIGITKTLLLVLVHVLKYIHILQVHIGAS